MSESGQSAGSLNGDGDTGDNVVFTYDARTGVATSARLAVDVSRPPARLAGGTLVLAVDESSEGNADRNGDGDAADHVLSTLRFAP